MTMIPLRVSLEGFLSYKEKQVIDFEGSSLWMLWGPNGVGKSAIFDAITFALYGSHRGGKSNAEELINHYSNGFVVEFDFCVDGVTYRIRRTHARKGHPIREVFLLNRDASDPTFIHELPVSGTDSRDGYKDWLQRAIGLDELAFTSSVLLLQGKSEQILNVEPKDRYRLLAELIDLSRYQQLSEAADTRRKNYEGQVRTVSNQLASPAIQTATEENLESARYTATQKNEQWYSAQTEVERFTRLLGQAEQWEKLVAELAEKTMALQTTMALLAKEKEIESSFQEWQALQQALPVLKQVVEQRKQITDSQQRVQSLQELVDNLSALVPDAQSKRDLAAKQVRQHNQSLEDLRLEKERWQRRLTALAPIIAKLSRVEDLQEQIAQLQAKAEVFPTDIEQSLRKAEERLAQLAAIERTLPWLQTFADERSELVKALTGAENARSQVEALQATLQEYQSKRTQLNALHVEAQETERERFSAKIKAHREFEVICGKLQRFEDTAAQQVCELCGQEISAEHAAREKDQLRRQIEEARRIDEEQQSLHQAAVTAQQQLNSEITALDTSIENVTNERRKCENFGRDYQNKVVAHTRQIQRAFDTIQSPFRERIVAAAPIEADGWLETTYPTDLDLQTFQDEVNEKAAQESDLKQLYIRYDEWQSIKSKKDFADGELSRLVGTFDVAQAIRDRGEKDCIDHELERLEEEISQQKERDEQAEKLFQEANNNYETLRNEEQARLTDLAAEQKGQEAMFRSLRSFIQSLPAQLQPQAEQISEDELAQLEQKRNLLASYESQYEQLVQARRDKTSLEQRIAELEEQIGASSLDACRPAIEVEQELACKKAERDRTDEERKGAERYVARLQDQWEQRMNLEQQKQDAERSQHLYKLLADLLGRGGLQLHLLREAEHVITDLANEALSGLSHGRMRLELRRENQASRASTEKALDLMVYDRHTGQYAIPINHASGSQRFRIAVSLALAIGRYSNRAAHRIESVIIDEGFGSLDKAGRDDMIQELHTLGQQLARIILVSHQDDFATAFPHRYSFKLVEKASYVTLVGDD
jgi:exonuclease SbcC